MTHIERPVHVYIRDNETRETRIYHHTWYIDPSSSPEEELDTLDYMWSEGNYACDCNRGQFFADVAGDNDPDLDCGSERYSVEKIIDPGTGEVLYRDDEPSLPIER